MSKSVQNLRRRRCQGCHPRTILNTNTIVELLFHEPEGKKVNVSWAECVRHTLDHFIRETPIGIVAKLPMGESEHATILSSYAHYRHESKGRPIYVQRKDGMLFAHHVRNARQATCYHNARVFGFKPVSRI